MIDVIIPVYEGASETRRCLDSVLATCSPTEVELVVVDDASPNETIAGDLDTLAKARRITLLRNERNAGFVRSVNRGMALHQDRDVILLNSDTEVANDWVARIIGAAHSMPKIATVTPFSNNATICSYPYHPWPGGIPGTLGLAALDRLIADINRGRLVDLPTAVGFCMFIRRECLQALGDFDAERFGRGYGEENDFCMRAGKAGWRNVLACDVFVFHEGSVSFSDDRKLLMESAGKALLDAHPEYGSVVRDFIAADPVLPMRQAIDLARARAGAVEALAVVAERAEERAGMVAELAALRSALAARENLVARLEAGLADATSYVAQRTADAERLSRELAQRDAAIGDLHEGLGRAEALAFARERELAQIRSFWLWKYFDYVRRKSPPANQPAP